MQVIQFSIKFGRYPFDDNHYTMYKVPWATVFSLIYLININLFAPISTVV